MHCSLVTSHDSSSSARPRSEGAIGSICLRGLSAGGATVASAVAVGTGESAAARLELVTGAAGTTGTASSTGSGTPLMLALRKERHAARHSSLMNSLIPSGTGSVRPAGPESIQTLAAVRSSRKADAADQMELAIHGTG